MIKKLLIITCALALSISAFAQATSDNGPKKGDVALAASIGYNTYVGMQAADGSQVAYELQSISTDWFDNKLMVGVDGNWFFTDRWSLRFGGGLGYIYNPGYSAVPGTVDWAKLNDRENANDIVVPDYRAVANATTLKYNVYTGFDVNFPSKVQNLFFHIGIHAGFAHGISVMKYNDEYSMGASNAEAFDIRGSFNFGIDYYLLPGMFIGFEVDPIAYKYNVTSIIPQAGLANLSADSHSAGFLSAPTLKIGFKF